MAVQNIVIDVKVDTHTDEALKIISRVFGDLEQGEKDSIKAFDAVNQKIAKQAEAVKTLQARENELKEARVRAQDPKLVESINKELDKTRATLAGLGKTRLFDDANIQQALKDLSEVQSKAAAARLALSKTSGGTDDVTRSRVELDLSTSVAQIERLKAELKGIDAGDLQATIRGSLASFSELNDETRAFALNLARADDEGKSLADELQAIDRIAKGTARSTGTIGDELDKLNQPANALKNIFETVKSTIVGAFVVEAVQNFTAAIDEVVKEFLKLNSQVELLFNRTGSAAIDVTSRFQALAETTDEGVEMLITATNALAKNFDLPIEKALKLVEDGFAKGANASQEFLDVLREYPEDFKRAGLSAEDFIKLTTVESKQGIFSDRLADSVREADIRINEARSGRGQLLEAVKLLGTEFEQTFKKKLKDPTFETLDAINLLFDEVKRQGKDINKGEFLPLAFGIGGEESKRSLNFINEFNKLNREAVKLLGQDFGKTLNEKLKDPTFKTIDAIGLILDEAKKKGVKVNKEAFTGLINFEQQANKTNETFVKTLEVAQKAKQAQNEFAASIAPVVTQLKLLSAEGQGFIFSVAKEFIEFAKESPELLGAVASAVALNTFNVTALASRTIALTTAQSIQIGVTGLLTRAQQALNNAIKTNPLGLILTAAGFVAVALKELYDRNETFRKGVDALGAGISKAFAPVVAFVGRVVDAFGEFAERAKLAERLTSILSITVQNNLIIFKFWGEVLLGIGKILGAILLYFPKLIIGAKAFDEIAARAAKFIESFRLLPPTLTGILESIKTFAKLSGNIIGLLS